MNRKCGWLAPLGVLAALLSFYLLMFLSYRAYDIDNPWFLSFSHGMCAQHIQTDQFLEVRFPYGMNGTQLFGKIAAWIQCAAIAPFGWQQWPAAVFSSTLITLSLGFWWIQLRKIGYTRTFSLFFIGLLGLSEPVLSAAERYRYEPVSFFLISLGMLLVAFRRPFWGIFIAGLALEIEPAAIAGLLAVLVFCWTIEKSHRRLLIYLVSGLAMSACVYMALHPHAFHSLQALTKLKSQSGENSGGFFTAYFIQRRRHLPELIFFIVAAVLYWRKRALISNHYLALSAGLITVLALIMPHGNPAYMIFLYPFLVAMAAQVLQIYGGFRVATLLVALCLLPQYALFAFLNRGHGYRNSDIALVSSAISKTAKDLGLNEDNVRIYGDYTLWFAHPNNYRAASTNTIPEIQQADIYLCYPHPIESQGFIAKEMLHCPDIEKLVSLRSIQTLTIRGNILHIYAKN